MSQMIANVSVEQ